VWLGDTVDFIGFATSCSAFYKPQAMNNINDCAIQLFSCCCNYIHVCGLGSRVLLFLQTQRNPQY